MADWLPQHVIEASDDPDVHLAFERQTVSVPISVIVPLKSLREGIRESKKYAQIVNSIKAIGLVEAPVIIADTQHSGRYFLLDGHLRIEALKELGTETVDCLVATDDETYTYNKRVNRLPPLQEHHDRASSRARGGADRDSRSFRAGCRVDTPQISFAGWNLPRGRGDPERHHLSYERFRHFAPHVTHAANRSGRSDGRSEQFQPDVRKSSSGRNAGRSAREATEER